MANETMTGWERFWAALSLQEKPDRVPVAPKIVGTVATFQGISQGEANRKQLFQDAFVKTFKDFGGWDAQCDYFTRTDYQHWLITMDPVRILVPGFDRPDDNMIMVEECEFMNYEDYDRIIEEGYKKFWYDDLIFRVTGWKPEDVPKNTEFLWKNLTKEAEVWQQELGLEAAYGGVIQTPFFLLSLGRSLIRFTEDLYYKPEKVEKAIQRMTDDFTVDLLNSVKQSGKKSVLIIEERAGAALYPLRIFERFFWQYTKKMVDTLWSEGIVSVFHVDTDWGKNIPYFKELPKGSFCLQLDSTTDMIAARKTLGNHGSLWGDIPATLMSLGSSQEVRDYCKRLVKEVGYDGGFILGTGCDLPIDCKPENFRTMLEVAKESFY
ncbi:MAG: uroporphyrinogen decarboxylase family protein [Dehalobacterium sp.]